MTFESSPRTILPKNPLVEVVTQVAFVSEADDFESGEKVLRLHNCIKEFFPLFKKAKSVSLNLNTDEQSVSQIERPIYEFSSFDESARVVVEADSMVLVLKKYESWEVLFQYIEAAYEAVKTTYTERLIRRVGLRYKNVIQRSILQGVDDDADWTSLLRESLISVQDDPDLRSIILSAGGSFTLSMDELCRNAKMNANYGIVKHAQSGESCFMIDSDYFIEGVQNYDSAKQFLGKANVKARDFFHWCITPALLKEFGAE
ncbi:MAG: TIGR04255 family protein [Thalassolituus maritimus]|uniref:TIGR04255 family protein n=1 Tax=Thalassolituus maritimus TaxID=484498 RepID=A0A1N7NMM5_9GAMM|nr:TIGR04255 family protein [Thalassolituus maritimus]TPD54529.1 MAG: TIGR04255 family protein [Thalassolituus maritimus]SIS99419.1 TIGR04255 family protein [Thalassolituus maritimus]